MSDVVASIDFESRSATDIRLGVERYSRDPQADVLMLAIEFPGMAQPDVWHRGHDLKQPAHGVETLGRLFDHVRAGGRVRGWNVMFEWHIWNRVCVPKYGWPPLDLEQLEDTMAEAAAMNLPQSLGKCAEVLGLPADQQKDKRGKYLIQRLCTPHPPTKKRPGIWVEDPDLFAEMVEYCRQDVVVEKAVARKLRRLVPFERRVWVFTQKMNLRGVPVDLDECARIDEIVESEKARLNEELNDLTDGQVPTASKRAQLLAWVNSEMKRAGTPEMGDLEELEGDLNPLQQALHDSSAWAQENLSAFGDMKANTVESALERTDLPANVRRALEIRAAVVQTSTAKYSKMLKVAADDGTLKNLFVYHGAGTGRWASRGGLNIQNFARPIVSDETIAAAYTALPAGHAAWSLLFEDRVMDAAVSCLRGVLKAPPGYEFVDADYSSVENRVAAWVSHQDDKLELFAKGLDEYKTFASGHLFHVAYEEVTKDQRQHTKPVILGGIFGLGAAGLVAYAKQYGVEMTLEQAKLAIRALRKAYRQVRNTWYECQDAMVAAIKDPGAWFPAGRFQFCVHRNFLWMKLPSDRVIAWAKPEIVAGRMAYERDIWEGDEIVDSEWIEKDVDEVWVESVETKTRQWCRHQLIGSSAFQSGVQGTARDILAHGAMVAEGAGYPIVLLAHDEALALVPEGTKDPDEFGRLLCTPAPWMEGLPLAYEAWRGKRYKKG